jgi:hypothetical protein
MGESRGLVEVSDRELELLGQIGDRLDDLAEGGLDVARQGLELGRGLDQVGHLLDLRDEVGLLADVVEDPDPHAPLNQDAKGPVGDLHHPRDRAGHADSVEVVRARCVELRVLGCDHRQHPVAGEDVIDEVDGALLPDSERGERVRVGDRLPQRQDREGVGQRLHAGHRLLDLGELHDLQLRSLHVSHCQIPFRCGRPLLGALDRDLARGLR